MTTETDLTDAVDTLKRTSATLASFGAAVDRALDTIPTAPAPRVRRWLIDLLLVVLIIAAGVLGVLL